MQIRELAWRSGVSAKTIRYYEAVGLLLTPTRAENNYRDYEPAAVERLRFIAGARSFGFAWPTFASSCWPANRGTPRVSECSTASTHSLSPWTSVSPTCWHSVRLACNPQALAPEAWTAHRATTSRLFG